MTATNQHIRNSGRGKAHQTSLQYHIIKVVANVAFLNNIIVEIPGTDPKLEMRLY